MAKGDRPRLGCTWIIRAASGCARSEQGAPSRRSRRILSLALEFFFFLFVLLSLVEAKLQRGWPSQAPKNA